MQGKQFRYQIDLSGDFILRKNFPLLLSGLMIFAIAVKPTLAQSSPDEKLRNRVVEWGTNKQVNVKLHSGEKINGRIAAIQNEYFEIQSAAKDGKITTQQINYSNINKLSAKGNAGRTAGMTALGAMAAVGAIFVMLFAIYAASES